MNDVGTVVDFDEVTKYFGGVVALSNVSFAIESGQVTCLLGDNGAGKSTTIKILSGVYPPDSGELRLNGRPLSVKSPRDALDLGIATVYQDLALQPLMSIARNFFLGSEPTTRSHRLDLGAMHAVAREKLAEIGIDTRDTSQPVGTLSGGEQQALAIARAEYMGARVLILDEPTSALGVREAAIVLRHITRAKERGLAVLFITHNAHHAYLMGDQFVVLNRGQSMGNFRKGDVTMEELLRLMAGGAQLEALEIDIEA